MGRLFPRRTSLFLGAALAGTTVFVVMLTFLWARGVHDVAHFAGRYPAVHYRGPHESPQVTLERRRPANWVGLDQVSRVAAGAIVISEDWGFYEHPGFDVRQIRDAVEENWRLGRYARGASTITQQVARNVFLTKEKTLWRKLRELVLAVLLEKKFGKRKILETYLNVAEWGEGIYGIGPAARRYFHKSPAELGAKEGAFLAMLLPNPRLYSASYRERELTRYASRTIDSILDKMVRAGLLTPEMREEEGARPLSFERIELHTDTFFAEPPDDEETESQ